MCIRDSNSGDQFTKCFQFTLDPTWDLTQMHIIGMLINPNGEIDNASSTSIATSIANGFHSCNSTSISEESVALANFPVCNSIISALQSAANSICSKSGSIK